VSAGGRGPRARFDIPVANCGRFQQQRRHGNSDNDDNNNDGTGFVSLFVCLSICLFISERIATLHCENNVKLMCRGGKNSAPRQQNTARQQQKQ
jgi:hypothetical protein